MRTSKINIILSAAFVLAFVVSACGSGQPTDEPAVEAVSASTVEPTPGPEVIELGEDIKLLLNDLPEGVTIDAKVDPNFKTNVPPSMNFDSVYTDTVLITITKSGEPVILEPGVAELCFTFPEPNTPSADPKPRPYYWDTSISPLVDGKVAIALTNLKTKICMAVQNSGAYAVVTY